MVGIKGKAFQSGEKDQRMENGGASISEKVRTGVQLPVNHEAFFKIQTEGLCGRIEERCTAMHGLPRWTTP